MIMEIDYNKLRIFLTIVECGGVTAAAKKLHRTQSAISQALASFEAQLGVQLVLWEGKRLKLTRQGHQVVSAAQKQMATLDEALLAIQSEGDIVAGCIEIGMLQDHATRLHDALFQIIAEFRKKHPAVHFRVRFSTSQEIEQALLDQKIDIGLLINFQALHRFDLFEVATEEHIVVSSSKAEPFESVQQVVEADLIDIDPFFTCFTPWVKYHDPESYLQLQKREPAIALPNFLAIRDCLRSGIGVAVLPRYVVAEDLENGIFRQVLPELRTMRVWLNCATLKGSYKRLCDQLFLEKLRTPHNN